jgi:type IV secretory pathway VirB2 component (pilin)
MRFFIFVLSLFFISKFAFGAIDITQKADEEQGIVAIDATATEGDKTNQLATSLCQLILLLNGRTGRAIAIIAVFVLAFMFMTSKLNVPTFLTVIIGLAMLFGAKSVALIMLPNYVKVKDTERQTAIKKTPDELVREVCPELK